MARSDPAEMQLTIDRDVLMSALSHVLGVVERRNTIPILSNLLIEAGDGAVRITSTNLDMAMVETIPATVEGKGAVTVPAQVLHDAVRRMAAGAQISLAGDRGRVLVKSGRARVTLQTLPAEDFPRIKAEDRYTHFVLPIATVRQMIDRLRHAICDEPGRYYLGGIFLHSPDGSLAFASTDGHRVAAMSVVLPEGANGMPDTILSRRFIGELRRLIDDGEENVRLAVGARTVTAETGSALLTAKVIEGTYPDYERVIPKNNEHIVTVDAAELAAAIDLVTVVATDKDRKIKWSQAKNQLTLIAQSAEHGVATEEIPCEYDGPPFETGFNSKYLAEQMALIDGAAVFAFAHPQAPVLITSSALSDTRWVLMPMRI